MKLLYKTEKFEYSEIEGIILRVDIRPGHLHRYETATDSEIDLLKHLTTPARNQP